MTKLNLTALNLKLDSNSEEVKLGNGKVINVDAINTIKPSGDVYCSYGEFFVLNNNKYFGVDKKEVIKDGNYLTEFRYNGKVLSNEEFRARDDFQ